MKNMTANYGLTLDYEITWFEGYDVDSEDHTPRVMPYYEKEHAARYIGATYGNSRRKIKIWPMGCQDQAEIIEVESWDIGPGLEVYQGIEIEDEEEYRGGAVPLVCEASSFEEAAEKLAEIGDCYEIDYENKYTVVWRVWRLGFPESWRLVGVEVVGEELQGKPTITYSSKYIEGMNMGNGHGLSPKP